MTATSDAGGCACNRWRARAVLAGRLPRGYTDEVLSGLSIADGHGSWQALLERDVEGAFTLVAERDVVVGFCSMMAPSRDDDAGAGTCEVAAVYVEPEHWREGIGSALLVTALQEVAATGWMT